MLKKASIVVAVTTAGLLAVSPLAFAGDSGKNNGKNNAKQTTKQSNKSDSSRNRSSSGLINVDALNGDILNNAQVCPNVNVDVIKLLGVLGTGAQGGQSTTCVNSNNNTNQSNDER
ncbi:MAG: hypothetical protein ACT4RN_03045 [Pseudonocardia sp.]